MSSNQWVNYGIAAVGAVVVGVATFGAGLSWYFTAALFTFSATASYLNAKYASPKLGGGLGPGAFGGGASTGSQKDAAAQGLQISSSSEAITIPVLFGTQRMSGNYSRYDKSSFRSVPIIERVQRDPSLVAYEQAKLAYRRNPDRVDHELDSAAQKQQEAQGGGGKGGQKSPPPPSESLDSYDKVGNYSQILLKKDQTGERKLPVEYDEYVVGYRYYLSFELVYCMGPVDRFEVMRSFPGEGIVIDNRTTPDVTAANSYAFTARGLDEGGSVRLYPGKANQTRETGDVYKTPESNYRNVAFAMFSNFYLGTSPAPKSYVAELTRFPVCLDADGNVLADFPVRGATAGTVAAVSATSWAANVMEFTIGAHAISVGQKVALEGFAPAKLNGVNRIVSAVTGTTISIAMGNPGPITTLGSVRAVHPCYYSANPAAILWEIFTNKLWGRGMNPDDLDVASFRAAAQYFEANNIGMDFFLQTQNLISDAIDTIRTHVSTMVIPVGGILRCVCLLDRDNAYTPAIRLTSDNVIDPEFSRPDWVGTVNELRATFMNRLNNFQDEVAIAQDDGNLATIGRTNSAKLALPAFGCREVTDRMTRMILQQMAQPQATLKFTMNRFESRIVPGQFIIFVWTEWTAGPTTTFWRVVETQDVDEDGSGIQVTCTEDLYVTPIEGAAETFEIGVPAFEGGTINDDDDLDDGDDPDADFDTGNLLFEMRELPFFLAEGQKIFSFFCNRDTGRVARVQFFGRASGSGDDFVSLGTLAPWSYFGTLQTSLAADFIPTLRRNTAELTIQMENPDDRATVLGIASLAPTADDDLIAMLGGETNWCLIGNEIFQVAQAEATATPGELKFTVYFRAQLGTEREAHAPGDRVIFFYQFIPRVFTARYDALPINTLLEFKAIPLDIRGLAGLEYTFTGTIENRARRAMPIEVWSSAGTVGLNWTVNFRPRFHNRGAATNAALDADANTFTGEIPDLYEWFVMPRDSGGTPLLTAPIAVAATLTPDDGNDPETGKIAFSYVAPATTDHLLLYTVYDGVLGFPVQIDPP